MCKTRGVEHLCRWETEPYARPPPARPPGRAGTRKTQQQQPQQPTVVTNWQVPDGDASTLYSFHKSPSNGQALLPWRGTIPSPSSPSQASLASSISRTSLSPIGRPNEGLKEAALALARMQLNEEVCIP